MMAPFYPYDNSSALLRNPLIFALMPVYFNLFKITHIVK